MKKNAIELFAIITIIIACAWEYVIPGSHVYGRDVSSQHIPYYSLIYREGQVPVMWNPYSHCGSPAFANLTYAMLYPLNLLAVIIPPTAMSCLFVFTHLFILALGLKKWLSIFCKDSIIPLFLTTLFIAGFSTQSILEYGHILVLSSLSWSIWVLIFSTRMVQHSLDGKTFNLHVLKWFLGIAISIGLCMLGAGIQIIHHTYLSIILWIIFYGILKKKVQVWKPIVFITLAHLIGGLLAWPQVHATMNFLNESSRSEFFGLALSSEGQVGFASLLKWLTPWAWGDQSYWGQYDFWFAQCYMGVIPIVALFFIKTRLLQSREVALIISSCTLFMLMLGNQTPLFKLYNIMVPMAEQFRFPVRYIYSFTFFMLPIFAIGLQVGLKEKPKQFQRMCFISLGVIFVYLIFINHLGREWLSNILPGRIAERLNSNQAIPYQTLFILFALESFLIFLFMTQNKWTKVNAKVYAIIAAAILFSFIPRFMTKSFFPLEYFYMPESKQQKHRILDEYPMVEANRHIILGKMSTSGYDSLFPQSYRRFLDTIVEQNWQKKTREQLFGLSPEFYLWLGAAERIPHPGKWMENRDRPILNTNQLYYLSDTAPLPPRKESPYYKVVADAQQNIYQALLKARTSELDGSPPGYLKIMEYSSEKVVLQSQTRRTTILASSENTSPHWRCKINGQDTEIHKWFGTFRAVILPKGIHKIEFFYDRSFFYKDMVISMLSWFICVSLLLWLMLKLARQPHTIEGKKS